MAQKKEIRPLLLNVAIYIRVSSEEQARHGDSLRDQLESGQDYINSHANMVLQDVYTDDGISGQKLDREEFVRLMNNVQNGLIDLIIFTKIDRWFRSLRHYLNTQAILEDYEVNWLATQQPYFDTSTPHGRAFIAQSMMWAELEAQNDSVRIRDVFSNKVKYGEVLSGKVPRGYSIVDKHLRPNDDAPMIYDIFLHYRDSGCLHQTLLYLRSEYNVVMSHENLKQSILKNTKYTGVFRDNKSYCPPIIPAELFDQVQELLSKNIKSSQKYPYIFSGLLVCHECGYKMSSCHINVVSKKKYRYQYPAYICRKYRNYKTCQNAGEIREIRIEEYLLQNIRKVMADFIAQYEVEQKPVKNNKAKRSGILKKMDKLKELFLNDCITLDEYKRGKTQYQAELDQLPETMQEDKQDFTNILDLLDSNFETIYVTFSNEEKRLFWRSFIKEIHVSKSHDRQRNYRIIFL